MHLPFPMILVTGAGGQVGTDLTVALRQRFGAGEVLATDLKPAPRNGERDSAVLEPLDVTDARHLGELIDQYSIQTIYHLAGVLSAKGEQDPDLCWRVNMGGLRNVLNAARDHDIRVFWPSSIAVFGRTTPRTGTPQTTVLEPNTMYGVTKVSGELLCQYYAERYGVDVRSLRLPGIISYTAQPGGGTTDYAVEMFYEALRTGRYTCFVAPDTRLPMLYMPDTIRAILELMEANARAITIRTSYNLAGLSFSAQELADEIRRHLLQFECRFEPDFRQDIADSWPESVDDTPARQDWGWKPEYDLPALASDMLANLRIRIGENRSASYTPEA
jgi:nucleoside-diphosphate-sugar epimerase